MTTKQYHKNRQNDWNNFSFTALEQLENLRINKLERTNIERISLCISSSDMLLVIQSPKHLKCDTNCKSQLPILNEGKLVVSMRCRFLGTKNHHANSFLALQVKSDKRHCALRIFNNSCKAYQEGASNTKSSAYAKILTHWSPIKHPTPEPATESNSSLMYLEKKRNGDKTPPCLVPLPNLNPVDKTSFHRTKQIWLLYQKARIFLQSFPLYNRLVILGTIFNDLLCKCLSKIYKASKSIATTTTIVINSLFKNICAETGGMSCFKAKLMIVDGTLRSQKSSWYTFK